jgi:hypothetical protein
MHRQGGVRRIELSTERAVTIEEATMTEKDADREPRPPLMQTVFDNIFLLLVIGLAVPIVFYTIWGLLEIASIPLAR